MKYRSLLAAVASFGIVLSTSALADTFTMGLVETIGSGPDTLQVVGNYSGAVQGGTTAIISGTTDNWIITVPGLLFIQSDTAWVEAPGDTGYNVVSVLSDGGLYDQISLTSDTAFTVDPQNTCRSGSALGLGATCWFAVDAASGINNDIFLSVNEGPPTATPLPAALPLFATGLGAMGLIGWRRKRKAVA